MEPLRDCSVVTTTYDMGDGMKGTIGIVGPKRMDYENVVDNLKILKTQLDNVFKKPDTDTLAQRVCQAWEFPFHNKARADRTAPPRAKGSTALEGPDEPDTPSAECGR